jgi:hypothetical protein
MKIDFATNEPCAESAPPRMKKGTMAQGAAMAKIGLILALRAGPPM